MMDFLLIALLLILAGLLWYILTKRKQETSHEAPEPPAIPAYDSEGYNRQGYNNIGRNRQGKYNRLYNVKCYQNSLYSEEGFLDIRKHPLFLTDHARERMAERMGICEYDKMCALAFDAYQFGKSKLQLMKSESWIIEEKEQEYEGSIILIYHNYFYVFTQDNGLKTVYKNSRVRA